MDVVDRAIVKSVQDGIPLVEEPYAVVARDIGITESELIRRIGDLQRTGFIKRFGARINHRRCGFSANAMVAWKVPEEKVEETGSLFAAMPEVTHCYERRIIPGTWEHNIFTMIHCRSPEEVEARVAHLSAAAGISDFMVLISGEEFKRTVSVRITDNP